MSAIRRRFSLWVAALFMACSFMACKGRGNSGEGSATTAATASVVYATTQVTPAALKDVFDALDKKVEGHVFVNLSTISNGDSSLTAEQLSQLTQKLNLDSMAFSQADVPDIFSEMKIPVCDTTVISYHRVGQFLAHYDFLINIGSVDRYSGDGFGGMLQMTSVGVATANGKTAIREGGPKAMAVAAKAVHDYYLGGKQIIYIMVMGDKEYGILASKDPVALDQACLDIVRSQRESGDTTKVCDPEGLRKAEETIAWAEKINLGCKIYKLECIN